METILLTGATGFLGSHLMASLLERGYRLIIFGRASDEGSLAARIGKLLVWFNLERLGNQIETAEVDLLKPFCGLNISRYKNLCAKTDKIIHCASDTRFSERSRQQIVDTNIHSLKEIIEFARNSKALFLHYISTAYTAGRVASLCTETPVITKIFTNVYEETKAQAEKEIATQCQKYSLPFTIIRPSIVYGDSQTGRASRFNALYNHVKSLYYIRDIYLNEINKEEVRRSSRHGIYLEGDTLHVPIKIVLQQPGSINLIPIDYFVSATLAILKNAEHGKIYHVTSDTPKTMEELASYCELFLKMKGVEIVYGNGTEQLLNPAEALFKKFIEPYRPYLSDTRQFDRSNTDRATQGLRSPELTYEIFERCMEYAVSVNWEDVLVSGRSKQRATLTAMM